MKIKHQLSIATLVMAGVFATGCSQQSAGGSQVSGGSQQQVEGGSQVSGGSGAAAGGSQQSAGGSQVASDGGTQSGSQQQVEEAPVVAPVAKAAPRRVVRPAPRKVAPRPAGNCHGHAANARTKSMRHCHPNPTASHRYGGAKRAVNRGGNRWGHTHPAVPRCTKSIRHTHKYQNARHSHKYSCQGMRPAPRRAAAAKQPVDVYALQRKLKAKGYYKGPIDGIVGSGTRSALKRFMNR